MEFKDLTPEQKEKAKGAKSTEELLALVAEEGLDLSDSDLEAIAGGSDYDCNKKCEEDYSHDVHT